MRDHWFELLVGIVRVLRIMILIPNPNPTSLNIEENCSFNIVSKYGLEGGHGFERLASMVKEGVKKHDTRIESKSYKLELLGKLVI